ncbi:hypothetical protein OG455_34310 [Kitasatospora sp. NBC_01287]|uniref:hypothetical protein n=1 Tax=Kitasatospora sp. NBC_01287 TaxID=2903573 RepID=UPI00224DE9B6|nr:hypothetical protein [Kitasatospora sp. NBC_01287]MCX4750528.1 hypothetical protein [Kitasatospora sp. NBC_01287]
MTITGEQDGGAQRRRRELQERHRRQLAALEAYDQALVRAARAQADLSRTVAEAVDAIGGLDVTAGLLDLTVKEVRTHLAAHEAAPATQDAVPAPPAAPEAKTPAVPGPANGTGADQEPVPA